MNHQRKPIGSNSPSEPRRAIESELGALLDEFLQRDGRSLNRVAHAAWLDVSYLSRLRAGKRQTPSRDVLIRLGLVLRLSPEEVDELLLAADYAPITSRQS